MTTDSIRVLNNLFSKPDIRTEDGTMIGLKQHSHEERVRVAEQICEKILRSLGEKLIAAYVVGSTAKKLDRPYSDLEMIAVVKDDAEAEPSMKYYVFDGLVIQVEYRKESWTINDARRVTREWPVAADEAHNRIILFEREGFFKRLDQAADESSALDKKDVIGYGMVGLFEGLAVILNAMQEKDEIMVRTGAFNLAVDAAKLVLLLNQKYIMTSSWFWKEARSCPLKPADFWTHVERLTGFKRASTEEIAESAQALVKEMLQVVEPRGVLVESSHLIV